MRGRSYLTWRCIDRYVKGVEQVAGPGTLRMGSAFGGKSRGVWTRPEGERVEEPNMGCELVNVHSVSVTN